MEWFSMQTFQVLLIDSHYGEQTCLQLLSLAWKYNPLTLGGVFSFRSEVSFKDELRFVGAKVYSFSSNLEGLLKDLQHLPTGESLVVFKILLVEDLDAPRDIICSYIESLGFGSVQGVSSVDEGLSLLRSADFSCVVSDLHMPNRSGLDLLAEIRADPHLSYLPVIILTTYSTPENFVDCLRAGATGFIVKPPTKKALNKELERAKRIVLTKQNPRLCDPEEALQLKDVLRSRFGIN